jgi:WhiB family redox-sensing transcriptional regulator
MDVEVAMNDFESVVPYRPTWMRRAACAGMDVRLFFPESEGDGHAARLVCSQCPVRAECLAFALAERTTVGIWGGTDATQRRKLRRKRTAA